MKKIIIAVGVLIVLGVIAIAAAAIFSPTEFKVEREITIDKPRSEIFAYAKMLRNQNEWGPWFKKEPTMRQEFRGTDGQAGFVSAWKGETQEVGEGEQEIKRIVEDERIETELRFKQPFESKADAYMTLEPIREDQTKVKWGFAGSMPRPLNLFMYLVDMDKEVGKDFQDGLTNLKTIMESR